MSIPVESLSIVAEKKAEKQQYMLQSKERRDVADKGMQRIFEMNIERSASRAIWRNRSVLTMIEDSLKRVAQYKLKPAYKKNWQQNLAGSMITDKLFEFLAKLAQRAMEVNVFSADEQSYPAYLKAKICNILLRAAGRKNVDDYQLIMEMLEAMTKGTVVGFEGWKHYKREVRNVMNEDPETGKQTYKKETITEWNDVFGCIWPLERVLFGNWNVSRVQEMRDIGLERVVDWKQWFAENQHLPDAHLVLPKSALPMMEGTNIFYTPDFVAGNQVYEVRLYDQAADEFLMLANGIWVNPLGKSELRPIPYNHKKLPVWVSTFRKLKVDFIAGQSHPDAMISGSDTYDKVLEAIIDQVIIALNRPIGADEHTKGLSEGYLYPGKIIRLKSGQREPKTIDVGDLSQGSVELLKILQARMERNASSADLNSSTRKTAKQIQEEVDAALETVALFLRFMEFGIRDKAELRLANIKQFYAMPVHKKDKEVKFKSVTLRNQVLQNGQQGTQVVEFAPQPSQERVMMKDVLTPGNTEFYEASPSFLRDFSFDLELVPGSSRKKTDQLLQTMEFNKQKVLAALHPQKFQENGEAFYQDILKTFGNDPSKYNQKRQEPRGGMGAMGNGAESTEELQANGAKMMSQLQSEPSLRELVNS